ncbi:MAG: metallophosphoesterase, partial [Kiritimatiellia bacterium]
MAENVSRRCFLGVVAGTLGACGGGCLSRGLDRFSRGLRLGLLSDIHLCAEEGDFGKFGDASVFVHALEWFRDVGVDGVVVAGDIADNGMRSQLNRAGAAWRKVFPGNRAPDGSKVEKLFVYGNHDLEGQHYDGFGQRFFEKSLFRKGWVATDPAGAWEEAFGEKYEPIWLKWVRGVAVVGAHWAGGKWGGPGAVEEWFRAHAGKFGPDAPLVYIQHPHLKDTCFGPSVWGHDVGCAGRALSGYRRAIALSGHAHLPATDDRFIWQGRYTSIGLGSLRYGSADGVQTLAAKGAKLLGQSSSWFTRQ